LDVQVDKKPETHEEVEVKIPVEEKEGKAPVKTEVEFGKPEEKPVKPVSETVEIQLGKKPTEIEEVSVEIPVKEEMPVEVDFKITDKTQVTQTSTVEVQEETAPVTEQVTLDIKPKEKKPEEISFDIDVTSKTTVTEETEHVTSVEDITMEIPTDEKVKETTTEKVSIEIPLKKKPEELQPTEITMTVTDKLLVEETSETVVEIVEYGPKFTRYLSDLTVPEGDKVEFIVEFKAEPAPTVTWFVDDQPLKETERYIVTVERDFSKLVIPETFLNHEGEYKVVVTNTIATITSICYLTVISKSTLL